MYFDPVKDEIKHQLSLYTICVGISYLSPG